MKTLFLAFVLAVLSVGAMAADQPPRAYTTSGGISQTWANPPGPAAATGYTYVANGTGLVGSNSQLTPLEDGRIVNLSWSRLMTNAALFAAARAISTRGVSVLLSLVPAFVDWVNGDGGAHIRVNGTTQTLQKVPPGYCTVAPCYKYQGNYDGLWFNDVASWAADEVATNKSHYCVQMNNNYFYLGSVVSLSTNGAVFTYLACGDNHQINTGLVNSVSVTSRSPDVLTDGMWLPASMDDIAPYMTARAPAGTYPDQVIKAGATIDVSPYSLTTALPSEPAPYVATYTFAKPADMIAQESIFGNAFSLANNTPTTLSTVPTPGQLTNPTKTSTGVVPYGVPVLDPQYMPTTTTATKVALYNPTTNMTSVTTTTATDAGKIVNTYTTTTGAVNTSSLSTVTVNNTYNSVTTNTTTNTVTNTSTKTDPVKASDNPDFCALHPEILACAKLGDTPVAELMQKSTSQVTVTPTSFASSSACPVPITFGVRGASYTFSYQPICDRLALLKTLFLAMSYFVAAWILTNAFKV